MRRNKERRRKEIWEKREIGKKRGKKNIERGRTERDVGRRER